MRSFAALHRNVMNMTSSRVTSLFSNLFHIRIFIYGDTHPLATRDVRHIIIIPKNTNSSSLYCSFFESKVIVKRKMRTFALLIALLALDAASAFSPKKAFGVWGVSKEASTTSTLQVAGDDNFEGLNLKKLLSAKQLKRMARINKRKANQAKKPVAVKAAPRSAPTKKATSGKKDPVKIIIAGAPASGKGTQCEGIQHKFGVVHLSTGDMLRAAVEAQTEVGKLAKEYMDSGKLVPDEVIIGVVRNREAYPRKVIVAVLSCALTVN